MSFQDERDDEEILTVTQAAEILGIDRRRVWEKCKDGTLNYQMIGRYKFPTRTSVEAYRDSAARILHMPKRGATRPRFLRERP